MADITADIISILQERRTRLSADVVGVAQPTDSAALGTLQAGFSSARTAPVGVIGLGSSTMAGVGATNADGRWFNQLAKHLRAVFPNGGAESPVGTLSTTRVTTAGLHFYNGGIGGATVTNYLTASMAATIGNIAPRAVLHQVGSNDVMNGVTAEQYRAAMIVALDRLDGAVPAPYVNVLIHAHRREGAPEALFAQYRQVLRDLAATRANCVLIDAERPFAAAGVPLPDRLDLLGADITHLTQRGHDMMFIIAAAALGVPLTSGATAAPAAAPTRYTIPLFTDTFTNNTGALVTGRVADNLLGGGRAVAWDYNGGAGEITVDNGALRKPAAGGNYFAGLPVGATPDYEFTFKLTQLHLGQSLYIVARRASPVLSPAPDDYRLTMEANGAMRMVKRVGGVSTEIGSISGNTVAGDRIGLRVIGTRIEVLRNHATVLTVTDTSLSAPGWVGVSGPGTSYGFVIDDLVVTAFVS